MDTKLTLNVDKEIANRAKAFARSKGRSLSDLVEDYFKFLTAEMEMGEIQVTQKVKSLMGSIRVPEDFDYKRDLEEQITNKYQEK